MTTTKKAVAAKSATSKADASATNAVELLTADHKEVKALFRQYAKLVEAEADAGEKQALANQIRTILTVHAQVEEEIFYPAAREALEQDQDLLDEAEVEHESAKDLIAQIESMSSSDELYDAKVTVLGEYIDHHVKEEEGEMFPKARKVKMDLETIGVEIQGRRDELMAEAGTEA